MRITSVIILLSWILIGCQPESNLPPEPQIELESISDSVINQQGTLTITFKVKDGDGDLGFVEGSGIEDTCNVCVRDTLSPRHCNNQDRLQLLVIDSRDGCFVGPFQVPNIDLQGRSQIEDATIEVDIKNSLCRTNTGNLEDTINYTVYIKDRAGNFSNKIVTPNIYLQCQ